MTPKIRSRLRQFLAFAVAGFFPLMAWGQTLEVIAITGDAVPEGNGVFSGFSQPVLNDAGQTAFRANLTDTSGGMLDDQGIYRGEASAGTVTLIVREKGPGPNGSGITDFEVPAINASGQLAFRATFLASHNDGGAAVQHVYRGVGGSPLTSIAAQGDAAPDGNGTYLNFGPPMLNDFGQVAFWADLARTTGGPGNAQGIFRGEGGAITQIAREKPAELTESGLADVDSPALNNSGEVAFRATFLPPLISTGTPLFGLYRGSGGPLTNVAIQGGSMDQGTFTGFGYPAFNDAGQAAFRAVLDDAAHDGGIFLASGGGSIVPIAFNGDVAPNGDGVFATFLTTQLNAAGQVAFLADLANTGFVSGIFRGDGTGVTQIARLGEVAPDGNGTYSHFRTPLMNDAGQVAFYASLSDVGGGYAGEGIYLANGMDTIPVVQEGDLFADSVITALYFFGNGTYVNEEESRLNDSGQVAFLASLANGKHAIGRYSLLPEVHWTLPRDGPFYFPDTWTERVVPNSFYDTFIDPVVGVTVAGHSADVVVKSLTIGATESVAVLDLNYGGDFAALESIAIDSRGQINVGAGHALKGSQMTNRGALHVYQGGAVQVLGGNYVQDSLGTLEIEFGGPMAEAEYNPLQVGRSAVLDGTLELQPHGDYVEPADRGERDDFAILLASAIEGTFAEILIDGTLMAPTFQDGDSFRSYTGQNAEGTDGLFRYVTYFDDSVVISNYLALPGDANGDGAVNQRDFAIWQAYRFTTETDWSKADFNLDHVTDVSDFNIWNENRGRTNEGVVAEPSSVTFLVLCAGLVLMTGMRRPGTSLDRCSRWRRQRNVLCGWRQTLEVRRLRRLL